MLTKLLNRFAQPQNSRDHRAVAIVARGLKRLMWLTTGSLVAGAYGVSVWDSRMGHVLVEVAGAAIVISLLHAGSGIRRLQREIWFRSICRGKRLALPPVLADGIAAAEMKDAPKTAEIIAIRLGKVSHFSDQSIEIFDCLMFDLLESNPSLSNELRQIAMSAQRKASALNSSGGNQQRVK